MSMERTWRGLPFFRTGFTPLPQKKTPSFRAGVTGFTAVEAVIVIGIVLFISVFTLIRFPAVSQSISLERSRRDFAFSLRKAQNMALAVRSVEVIPGLWRTPAGGFGIYFNTSTMPNSYLIFADVKVNGSNGGRYTSAGAPPDQDVIMETVPFEPGIGFGNIVADLGGANELVGELHIVFSIPEARVTLTKSTGPIGNGGQGAEMFLSGREAMFTRSVVVRTTGQIQVK